MTERSQAAAGKTARKQDGIFLPSMTWTADPELVARENHRLLVVREQLDALVSGACATDECATWHVMAEAALEQLDRDIDTLFNWLDPRIKSPLAITLPSGAD